MIPRKPYSPRHHIMIRLAFILALAVLIGLTVFIFRNYPLIWQANRLFRITLMSLHLLGTLALAAIFTCYPRISWEPVKWAISRMATFYYVVTMMLAIWFGIRMLIRTGIALHLQSQGMVLPPEPRIWPLRRGTHAAMFLILAFAQAAAGMIRIGQLETTSYEIKIKKPAPFRELNMTLIADIHAGAGTWKQTYPKLAEEIRKTRPDILLIGGDVFDETTGPEDVEYVRSVLTEIRPKYGTVFVYGNHDTALNDWSGQQMRSMGVTVLEDEILRLGPDGILRGNEEGPGNAGASDHPAPNTSAGSFHPGVPCVQLVGRLDPKLSPLAPQVLMEHLHADKSLPLLILQHRPVEMKAHSLLGCDLVMAGHTHGFNIPQFLGVGLWSDMYFGKKKYGSMTAVVTSGVSAWGFHYKWPAKSEVVSIRLHFH